MNRQTVCVCAGYMYVCVILYCIVCTRTVYCFQWNPRKINLTHVCEAGVFVDIIFALLECFFNWYRTSWEPTSSYLEAIMDKYCVRMAQILICRSRSCRWPCFADPWTSRILILNIERLPAENKQILRWNVDINFWLNTILVRIPRWKGTSFNFSWVTRWYKF